MRPFLLLLTACAVAPELDDLHAADGLYDATLEIDPDPPTVGDIDLSLLLRDRNGAEVSGCQITCTATMPEHGHGGMMEPEVVASEGGRYEMVWPCGMAGHWDLEFDLDCPGGADRLTVDLDVD